MSSKDSSPRSGPSSGCSSLSGRSSDSDTSLPLGAEASNLPSTSSGGGGGGRWAVQGRSIWIDGPRSYEEVHLERIAKLLEAAERNDLEDPITAWIELIDYMEEYIRAPDRITIATGMVYMENMQKAADAFYNDPQYVDDPRYIKLYMKNAQCQRMPPVQERRLLLTFLEVGHGRYSGALNMRIAELYISEGTPANAIGLLQRAIKNGAEPKEALEQELDRARKILLEEVNRRLGLLANRDQVPVADAEIETFGGVDSSNSSAWDKLVEQLEPESDP